MEWQPMDTAPLETPILIYGYWNWYDVPDTNSVKAVRVGEGFRSHYDEDMPTEWTSVTENPYKDECLPICWKHIEEPTTNP